MVPIEIKSGKDYSNFRALPKLLLEPNYHMDKGYVLSNNRDVRKRRQNSLFTNLLYNVLLIRYILNLHFTCFGFIDKFYKKGDKIFYYIAMF